MADGKTRPTTVTAAAFLANVASAERRADARLLIKLMRLATGAPPVMWGPSIIGFGCYRYRYESGREGESPLVGFSPRKAALVVYVVPGFADADALLAKLGPHKTGKSCLYLKRLADVDLQVLRTLIERSVATVRARYPQ